MLRSVLLAVVSATAPLCAQGQQIAFFFTGTASGRDARFHPSVFQLRAGSLAGSHLASAPLQAGWQENELSPSLVAAAAANAMTVEPQVFQGVVTGFRLTAVDGLSPSRGCLFGTDDVGITTLVGSLSAGPTSRFHGAAFAKATTMASGTSRFTVEVVGASTTDGHLFGVYSVIDVAAGETAAIVNDRIRATLVAGGCTVFDLTMPGATSGTTIAGFGVDRFDGLAGAQLGHSFRVSRIGASYIGNVPMPRLVGLGWFPTGGFAEYGRGFANAGMEPFLRGEGDYAPGGDYDVVVDFGRHTAGLLASASDRAGVVLPGGMAVLLDTATIVGVAPFVTNGQGRCVRHVHTPDDPALIGRTLHYQAFGHNATGLAMTSGLYCRVWQ